MNHEQVSELLAVLALDAIDDEERLVLEAHVATCPRCQSELDSLREVAGALGNSVEPLPEHLWSSISSRIYEDRGDATPPLALIDNDPRASRNVLRRSRASHLARTLALPIAVAAVIVAVLAFQLVSADQRDSNLQSALNASSSSQVAAALKTPGHELVNLKGSADQNLAKFVLLPDGRGYLMNSKLPTLSDQQTYQLWGIIGGKAISIGLMGRSPIHVAFTIVGPPNPTELAVTVEPSGGTSTPTTPSVASGTV
ncbi:MAG: anti-sigma factor [Acidimicrobiales bacterium]